MTTTAMDLPGIVSPELVLVDPDLAKQARASLADRREMLTHSDSPVPAPPNTSEAPSEPRHSKPRVFPVSFPDNGSLLEATLARHALERLVGNAATPHEPDLGAAPRRRLRRVRTLVPASSAALATTLIVAQLYLNAGRLG